MTDLTAIIILAAGNSSRLGKTKQLLHYKNSTLLKNTVAAALLVPNAKVFVVTGADHELIQDDLDIEGVKTVYNPDWENGMATSITKGLKELLSIHPEIQKCIFTVCDQPYISGAVFENLINQYFKTGKGIVTSSYSGTFGTPALFDKKYFDVLMELKGQKGAKKVITQFLDDTASILFEKGAIDIDTIEDYNNLIG